MSRKKKSLVSRIYAESKTNLFGAFIGAVVVFFLGGVSNAVFSGFFSTCGTAIRNVSSGVWVKIIDMYYISAAKSELTDISAIISLMALIFPICYAVGFVSGRRAAFRRRLHELDKGVKSNSVSYRDMLLQEIKHCRVSIAVVVLLTGWTFYVASVGMFCYQHLKEFRIKVAEVRPVLSEAELHMINRSWVLMKSKADYERLMAELARHAKACDVRFGCGSNVSK